MENAVVQQIKKKVTRSKYGEIFFVSSFPQYDVEYVTKFHLWSVSYLCRYDEENKDATRTI